MEELINKPDQKILDIELEDLRHYIPGILLNKLLDIGLKTINDYLKYPAEDYSYIQSVGERSLRLFSEMKHKILNEPEYFLIQHQKKIVQNNKRFNYQAYKLKRLSNIKSSEGKFIFVNHKILDITLDDIFHYIPGILRTKFKHLGLKTIANVLEIPNEDFLMMRGCNYKALATFIEFKNNIIKNPGETYDIYQKHNNEKLWKAKVIVDINTINQLPINPADLKTHSFLEIFKSIIVDYANLLANDKLRNILFQLYGINSERFTLKEIAEKYNKNREGFRQILQIMLKDLRDLCNGKKIFRLNAYLKPDVAKMFKASINTLTNQKFYSYNYIIEYFRDEMHETIDTEKENLIRLYIDVILKTALWSDRKRKLQNVMFRPKKINKNEILILTNIIKKILRESSISLSESEIFNRVIKTHANTPIVSVRSILQVRPEITIDQTTKQKKYYIRKSIKMRYRDKVYEMLKQGGKVMSINEILNTLNKTSPKTDKTTYSKFDLHLSSDERFRSIKKTGFWGLSDWNTNNETYYNLVKNVIIKIDKPATGAKILEEILSIRPQSNIKAVKDLVGFLCSTILNQPFEKRFENKIYVLTEWENRFPELKFKPKIKIDREKRKIFISEIRNKMIGLINSTETKLMRSTEIVNKIRLENPQLNKKLLNKLLHNKKYFQKIYDDKNQIFFGIK
jgi:hypothetical protein